MSSGKLGGRFEKWEYVSASPGRDDTVTTPMLTDAEIAELRRLEKAATPGPWRAETEVLTLTDAGRKLGLEGKPPARETTIHTTWNGMGGCPNPVVTVAATPFWEPGRFIYIRPEDSAVLAAARNALPSLLSEVEAARRSTGRAPPDLAEMEGLVDALLEAATDNASCPSGPESDCAAQHLADLNSARTRLLSGFRALAAPVSPPAPGAPRCIGYDKSCACPACIERETKHLDEVERRRAGRAPCAPEVGA